MKRKSQLLRSFLVLSMFLILAGGSFDDQKKIEQETKEEIINSQAIQISARQLYKEYEANGVAADALYKGNILEVYGTVNNIDRDITDNIYVTLKGDDYIGDVQCFFSEDYLQQAASLTKGQKITVTGKCDGKLMNVMLKGCILK